MTGLRSHVSYGDYSTFPGISITRLKELKRSPLHYRYRLDHPRETDAMRLGTAAHCAVLEPDRFLDAYAIWSRRTASGNLAPRNGQWWEAFKVENEGKDVITEDECATALAIQQAVRTDPCSAKYLAQGDPELSMQWEMHDRLCKGRADWLTYIDGAPNIVGLKTARDCREIFFGNAAAKLGYGMQWAWYWAGFKIITGETPIMKEIVVESEPPYATVVYNVPMEVILRGEEEYLALLDQLTRYESEQVWPGPAEGRELDVSMPTWWYGQPVGDDLSDLELETA